MMLGNACRVLGVLVALTGFWAGRAWASMPLPPGYEADLCPDTRRADTAHCVFGFGAGRRLQVPWSVFTDPRWRRGEDPRVSTYGVPYRVRTWPLGYCRPWDACAPAVGDSGRREALPGRHPFIFESWTLRGVLLPDGEVLNVASATPREEAAERADGRLRFTLMATTGAAEWGARGENASTSTVMVRGQAVALRRECRRHPAIGTSCLVAGQSRGVSFHITWSDRDDIASEAMFAAAASLFDRYVIEGERIGP